MQQEFYLAVTTDYSKRCPVIIVSRRGGVDIEELAEKDARQILKMPVDILMDLEEQNLKQIEDFAGADITYYIQKLYTIFRKHDAELIEINPLIKTSNDDFIAVDAVLNINDDSLFRQIDLADFRKDFSDVDPIVEEARANKWTYIDLPGDIAILSSGAGLTMAILDLIHYAGGSPANFIDTAQIDEEGIYRAFKLLVKATSAKTILVNIFAGLNRCDSLAMGINRYLKEFPLNIPIVVRMVGNKEELGHKILRDAGINPVSDLEDAVKKVVEYSNPHYSSKIQR